MNDPNAATWQWRVNKGNREAADHRYQERFGVPPPPPTERLWCSPIIPTHTG